MLKQTDISESIALSRLILTTEDYLKEMDRAENDIARYPIGFRQYENYDNYRTVYPNATLEEYSNDSKSLLYISKSNNTNIY